MNASGIRRRLKLFAYLTLFLYLTFLGGTFYSDFVFGLRLFHQAVATLLFGMWLLWLLKGRERGLPVTGLEAPLFLFMGARFVSAWIGIYPRMSLELFWQPLTHLVGFYWLVWFFRRRGRVFLLRTLYLTAAVVCIVGLIEFVGWYVGLPFLPVFQEGWLQAAGLANPIPPVSWRLNFTLTNATSLSAYLSLLIPPALAMGLNARRRDGRLAWWGWAGMALVVQLLTRSRGGLLALGFSLPLLGGAAAIIYNADLLSWARRLRRRKVAWVAAGLLLMGFAGGAALLLPSYLSRVSTLYIRLEMWRCALEMVASRPFFGVGTGLYGQALRSCLSSHTAGFERFTTAHNLYLNVAAESGLIALAALLWLLARLLWIGWQRWQNAGSGRERLLVAGVGAALVGFGANCLVDTLPATPLVLPVMFLTAWLVTDPVPQKTMPAPPRWSRVAAASVLALLFIYAAALVWIACGQWHFERSVRLVNRGELGAALKEIEQARQIDSTLALYDFQRAYYLGLLSEREPDSYLASALTATADALAWDDTYSVHHANLAALCWQAGDADGAIAAMERAVTTNPPDPNFWLNLGLMREEAGLKEDAILAYATALSEKPAWAGSDFWHATPFRHEQWPAILASAREIEDRDGLFFLATGELGQASEIARQQIATAPDHPLGYLVLGQALLDLGRLDEAGPVLDEGVRRYPGSAELVRVRAEWYRNTGQWEAASRDARIALFISPYGAARARYTLGQIALAEGDVEEAKDQFWRAIPPLFDSQNWEVVLFNRRALLLPLPQLARISGGPTMAEPWLALADLYLAEDNLIEALRLYRLWLDRDPYSVDVQSRLVKESD